MTVPQPEDISTEEQTVDEIHQSIYLLNAYMLTND